MNSNNKIDKVFNHSIEIPNECKNKNIYINITNIKNSKEMSKVIYYNKLITEINKENGTIRILNKETLSPISKVYIKVYAFIGFNKFHKDGYTDRRGLFNYLSVTCNHLTQTTKFAILINTQSYGSLVKIVNVNIPYK